MSSLALGILVVFLASLAAAAGLSLVRRLTSLNLRKEHNDVAGFIYSVLGVAYAVVLGFVLVTVWQRYETAVERTDQEGAALTALYFHANALPDSDRDQV
jgi:cytochrome c oxidase assembly factor CtaG